MRNVMRAMALLSRMTRDWRESTERISTVEKHDELAGDNT